MPRTHPPYSPEFRRRILTILPASLSRPASRRGIQRRHSVLRVRARAGVVSGCPSTQPSGPAGRSPAPVAGARMGLAAGGQMSQKIYPDPYGLEAWDQDLAGTAVVHLVNSEQYRATEPEHPRSVSRRPTTKDIMPGRG
jgi:hypothetical protein